MEWEYLIASDLDTTDLNNYGKDGWELVAVHEYQWENVRKGGNESRTTFFFKRQVYDERLRGLIEYRVTGTGIHLDAIPPGRIERVSDERAPHTKLTERSDKGASGTIQAETRTE